MPYTIRKRGPKYRIVETNTGRIAKNKGGTAMDGGGKTSRDPLKRQIQAVNISKARKKGHKIPKK